MQNDGRPPADVPAPELFAELIKARPSQPIEFPRKDPQTGKPILRARAIVLSELDHERARIEAAKKYRKKHELSGEQLRDPGVFEALGDATAREVLAMAICYEDPFPGSENVPGPPRYPRVFASAEQVGEMSADELMILFHQYQLVQRNFGPIENRDIDADAWIKRLEEGASAFPFSFLTLPQLEDAASSLAARISSLYRILATQWPSLPDTLRSDLESFSSVISWFGSRAEGSAEAGSESSPEEEPYEPVIPTGPVTIEDAADIARKITPR